MKFLNVLDFGFQTFIIGIVGLFALSVSFMGEFESIGIIALYGAVFLGPWQMISSLVTTMSRGLYLKWRVIHLVSASAYIAALAIIAGFFDDADAEGGLLVFLKFLGFGVPLVLALFYYFITIKTFQLAHKKAV